MPARAYFWFPVTWLIVSAFSLLPAQLKWEFDGDTDLVAEKNALFMAQVEASGLRVDSALVAAYQSDLKAIYDHDPDLAVAQGPAGGGQFGGTIRIEVSEAVDDQIRQGLFQPWNDLKEMLGGGTALEQEGLVWRLAIPEEFNLAYVIENYVDKWEGILSAWPVVDTDYHTHLPGTFLGHHTVGKIPGLDWYVFNLFIGYHPYFLQRENPNITLPPVDIPSRRVVSMESGQPKELALTEIMERLEFVRFFSPNSSVQTPLRVAEGDAFWTSSKGVQAQFRDSVSGTLFEVYAFIEVQNSLDGTWRDPGGDGELEISSDEINSPWRIMCRYPLHPINPSFRYFGDRHLYPFLFLDVPNGNIGEGVFSENLEIAPITSPVPRTNFGSSFRRVNGTTSTGYGVFDDRSFPWLWSENHGWWYWSATGSVARTFDAYWWVWDTQLGWLRVEEFEREFFWTGTKWYYFAGRFESGLRWFYDFSNGEWFSVE